ncbi:hypothetical protein LINGRAHAP2_LOCUS13553 [Linum grandiflorum]
MVRFGCKISKRRQRQSGPHLGHFFFFQQPYSSVSSQTQLAGYRRWPR